MIDGDHTWRNYAPRRVYSMRRDDNPDESSAFAKVQRIQYQAWCLRPFMSRHARIGCPWAGPPGLNCKGVNWQLRSPIAFSQKIVQNLMKKYLPYMQIVISYSPDNRSAWGVSTTSRLHRHTIPDFHISSRDVHFMLVTQRASSIKCTWIEEVVCIRWGMIRQMKALLLPRYARVSNIKPSDMSWTLFETRRDWLSMSRPAAFELQTC